MSDQEDKDPYLYEDDDHLEQKTTSSTYQEHPLHLTVRRTQRIQQPEPYYDKDTFNYDNMFIKVTEHKKHVEGMRYDDTVISSSQQSLLGLSKQSVKVSQNGPQQMGSSYSDFSGGKSDNSWSKTKKSRIYGENQDSKGNFSLNILGELDKQSSEQQPNADKNQIEEQQVVQDNSKTPELVLDDNDQQKDQQANISPDLEALLDQQQQVMELDVSGIQQNQEFEQKMNLSFSKQKVKYQQSHAKSNEESILDEETKAKKLEKLEAIEIERLIIRFKYQNCYKISMKCITHQLSRKQEKPKKIEASSYLKIENIKFVTNKASSENQLWEIGQSKIPIQILCVSMVCHYCKTGMNLAYSRQRFFSTICKNQECMKPISFEITEMHPSGEDL